jgi:hypothetical protein
MLAMIVAAAMGAEMLAGAALFAWAMRPPRLARDAARRTPALVTD